MKRILISLLFIVAGPLIYISFAQSPKEAPREQKQARLQSGENTTEEAVIREGIAKYVTAFNAHDAKALAAFWSPDAVYINRMTNEEVTGQPAIVEQFTAIFKTAEGLKLEVDVESVRFLSPSVAVEKGSAKLQRAKEEAEEFQYSAVYVKRDGKWLLDRVTDEDPPAVAPSHYEQLKVLEWMVGDWIDQDEDVEIETNCKWAKNQNFLIRSFSVKDSNGTDFAGMQVIGWDAATKSIRSWTFDSDGGTAEANWTKKADKWFIRNKGVLANGEVASMVNVIKQVDENSFTWQTIERTAGGEVLPNVDEVIVTRK